MKLDKKQLPKIISIVIGSLLALVLIFVGFKLFQGVFTKAADSAPREVVITAIAQNTAKIAWSTDQETQAVIEYGTSPTALNFFSPEAIKGRGHSVNLTLLSPSTTYYFQIRVGDQKYDNGGVPWTFTTKAKGATDTPEATPSGTLTPTAAAIPSGSASSAASAVRPCRLSGRPALWLSICPLPPAPPFRYRRYLHLSAAVPTVSPSARR